MKKKLLIGLSSVGLAAGFWACGDGTVEPMNEATDSYLQAMFESGSIDFSAQVADAKKTCVEDLACQNEMAKANGTAIQIESSEDPISVSSSDGTPTPGTSSSVNRFSFGSSIGPVGQQSSSSEAPVQQPTSSSGGVVAVSGMGSCAPAAATAELNSPVVWSFSTAGATVKLAPNDLLKAQYSWTFGGEGASRATCDTTGSMKASAVSYSVSGPKSASVTVSAGGNVETITCSALNVNGAPITGCKCLGVNLQPDVSKGESAEWMASGCSTAAGLTLTYTWTKAVGAGESATAAVAAKGDIVSGVSYVVENGDNTKVTIPCEDAVAMDATKPDYEFKDQGNTNAISFTGNVDATVVFSLPSGWHGSDAGTCTFACQVDRGGSGDGKISGTLGTYEVSGGDYVTTSIPVSATTGGNALAFKLNVGSNAGVNCHVAW
ncbi:MAG: hypothetical protein J5791_04405 [Fibrobacter sp.]|nr:hypothetical protein [Fibrobacter sp.]